MIAKSWSAILIAVSVLAMAFVAPVARGSATAEWTVLVYLDGDNNLDPDSVSDIEEMKLVGSTDKVNVLVLWDRYYEPAYVYKVVEGGLDLVDGLQVNGVPVNGQEISMADWRVLDAFVEFGKSLMPANHYMLDLWDHGSPYGYACWDDHADPAWSTPDYAIGLTGVGDALEGTGTMDILTYDGCTISMVEIAYELALISAEKGAPISYLVASEEYIPNQGYGYDTLLSKMNSMNDVSPEAVAQMMADVYAQTYSAHGSAKGCSTVGLSVIDLSMIGAIGPAMKALTDVLDQKLAENFKYWHGIIAKARGEGNLGWSLNGWDDRVDVPAFLLALSELTDDEQVKCLAEEAFAVLTDAIYVANTPALQSQGGYGIGGWFPGSLRSLGNANTGGFGVIDRYSDSFRYASDAGWMDFLFAFWGKML